MTHLQTANNYPDMVGIETIQQFAMLNQITLSSDQAGGTPLAGNSYPINDSYAAVPLPIGVLPPQTYWPIAKGWTSATRTATTKTWSPVVKAGSPGFSLSARWEILSALLAKINQQKVIASAFRQAI